MAKRFCWAGVLHSMFPVKLAEALAQLLPALLLLLPPYLQAAVLNCLRLCWLHRWLWL
jgi:hypothetical protein